MRVESLADDVLRMNEQSEETAQQTKRHRPLPVAANAETHSHNPNDPPEAASDAPTAPSNSTTTGNSPGSETSGAVGTTDASKPRRSGRAGAGSIDLFSQSEHAAWSEAYRNRGHEKVGEFSYDELVKQRDAAVVELDRLTEAAKRDRAQLVEVFDRVKSSLDDDVDEKMVRIAA